MRILIIFPILLVYGEDIPELEEGTRTAIIEGRYNGTAFSEANPELGNFLSSKSAQLSITASEDSNQFKLQVIRRFFTIISTVDQQGWLHSSRCESKSKLAWKRDIRSICKTQSCRIRSRSSVCSSWAVVVPWNRERRARQRCCFYQARNQPSWNELRSCWRDTIKSR